MNSRLRIGNGFDVHRLVSGRRLILLGREIPCAVGLLGHSDADVAAHALADALCGAAALGDIGKWFPDNDPQYAGADSMQLLAQIWAQCRAKGYALGNVDVTICAQQPKLSPFIDDMRHNTATVLECTVDQINVKATTTEQLGFVGRQEGMAAMASVLLC